LSRRSWLTAAYQFGAGAPKPIRDMPIEDYRAQVEVHNIGGFLFLRTALKALAEQDLQAPEGSRYPVKGSVVLLTSLASEGAFIGVGNYTAAKFAVKGLVQTAGRYSLIFSWDFITELFVALENASQGIRINAVAPSYVSGGMMDTFLEQSPPLKKQMLGDLPMGRLVDPDEVADAVLFLASPSSSYINGHTLVVDGGASLQLANTPFSSS
jgi:NAD(P)-dependent dehydrogenase (short-subunit alcohol dehydrogenase family)